MATRSTNYPITYQQNKNVVDMPNTASVVSAEVDRLKKEILFDITSLINFDYADYSSIDYFPESSTEQYIPKPTEEYKQMFFGIVKEIKENLRLGTPGDNLYDYPTYAIKYFDVSYATDGAAVIKFSMPISANSIDDLSIVQDTITIN